MANYNFSQDDNYKLSQSMVDIDRTTATLMRNVYAWMAAALTITGITAYIVANSPTLLEFIYSNTVLYISLFVGELLLVFVLSARINKLSLTTATVMFIIYSILNGVTISSILLVYTQESVAGTFFITAGAFAAMAIVGSFLKKDLSGMGRFFIMALIGLIIASIVNIFLKSSQMYWLISIIGVILFTGLTVYDAQKIKNYLAECDDVNEQSQKIALLGALELYLDFINLFLYLIRIFGKRK